MGESASTETPAEGPAAPASAGGGSSPVAVVWCRQVDNEAESPGYTTIPEEFPGHRETLDAIRIVGNLTINIADTHDYWDPDPTQPLSYYPNLFLYPAFGGRYTCVGRMFLSTEDRPRLGMKTLVLETAPLLASGEYGEAVLRWHASMGGARNDSQRGPVVVDPKLYATVGEGFLFHRGSTSPLLIVASDQWEATVEAILDLLRALPTSLVALGAVLVFPYFLPQPKTNLHELAEQVPLSIAVMRVARGEAQGDRYEKRVAAWDSTSMTLRDLTQGVPSASKGKETAPLILQYVRDHQMDKLRPITQRVDHVELPRLTQLLGDPDRAAGKDRRKEMWRIGTAMESAALLLQKQKGRSVSMSGETAKRANEYVRARPTPPEAESLPVEAPVPAADVAVPGQLPPWLQRLPDLPPTSGANGAEVVPMSTSDDPSLLPPTPSPTPAGLPPPPPPPPPPAADTEEFRREVVRTLTAYIEERLQALSARTESSKGLGGEGGIPPSVEQRLKAAETAADAKLARALVEAESRLAERMQALQTSQVSTSAAAAESLRSGVEKRFAELEQRVTTISPELSTEIDRRVKTGSDALVELARSEAEKTTASIRSEISRSLDTIRSQASLTEEELRSSLSAQLDLHLREAEDREKGLRNAVAEQVTALVASKNQEADAKRAKEVRDLEQRLQLLIEGRTKDLDSRLTSAITAQGSEMAGLSEERVVHTESRMLQKLEERAAEVQEAQVHSAADLQVRLQSYFDQKLRENLDREQEKVLELLARMRTEVDGSLARIAESPRFDQMVRERVARAIDSSRGDTGKLVESRIGEAERRLRSHQEEVVVRLERLETKIGQREQDLLRLEQTVHNELDDVDRRTQVLSDRLVPVVRKAWLEIARIQKTGPTEETEIRVKDLRREFARELRRIEGEFLEQTAEIRERIENALTSQGRVWLTLVRQLTQLTESRRALEQAGTLPMRRAEADEEEESIGDLPDVLYPRSRGTRSALDANGTGEETPYATEDEERVTRRRRRS